MLMGNRMGVRQSTVKGLGANNGVEANLVEAIDCKSMGYGA